MSERLGTAALLTAVLSGCGPDTPPRALLDWSVPVAPSAAPAQSPPALHVDGTQLLTAGGAAVHLRGVNVCSLEFDAAGATWGLSAAGSTLLTTLADPARWKVNVVRVPVNQQWFLEDEAYVGRVEAIIDHAARLGLYVVLDVQWEHGQRTEPYSLNILERPTFGTGNTTEAFWLSATSRWANRTNLLLDLVNEPHGHPPEVAAAALQALIDAIRSRTADPVIVVGGPDWAHSLDPWRVHPLAGANLVYSAHQYLPYDPPADFEAKWRTPAQTLPVLLGEFLDDPAQPDYAHQVVDAAEASGVTGWLPWAIGCGFSVDDDTQSEPSRFLAAKMRALN
jgi:hypothetical protein